MIGRGERRQCDREHEPYFMVPMLRSMAMHRCALPGSSCMPGRIVESQLTLSIHTVMPPMTLHIGQTGDLVPRMKAKFGGKNPMN